MKLSGLVETIERSDGAVTKSINGLHDARVGDIIKIGVEGSRHKIYSKIAKIVANNRLQDSEGNVFGRDGMVYRRKGWELRNTKGKIVSAKHVTQKELDQEHHQDVIRFLTRYNWDTLSPEQLETILKTIRVSFGDIQKTRSYIN